MTISTSAYFNLRNEIILMCNPYTEQQLQQLKNNFRHVIKSTRRLENIRNIGELVCMLEKRNALNLQNLDALNEIVRILDRNDLMQLLNRGLQQPIINVQPPAPLPVPQRQQHVQRVPVLNFPPPSVPERIYDLIINQIGSKWKELARNLTISEGKIDELEDRYRLEPSERVREILQYFELNSRGAGWFPLLDALSRSRRTDLRIEVQKIIAGN